MSKKLVYGPATEQPPTLDSPQKSPKPRKAGPVRDSGPAGTPGQPASGLYRPVKQRVTIRLDADVIAWFKAQAKEGPGYQTLINRVLREHMLKG